MDIESAPARLRGLPTWLLGQASLEAQRLRSTRLGAVGANRQQYSLLAALDDVDRASQAELGRRLGVDPGDMVRLVAAIEAEGWLEREPDPEDRRRNLVAITPAGRRRLTALDAVIADLQDELLAPLTPADRGRLVELLTRVVDHHHTGASRA